MHGKVTKTKKTTGVNGHAYIDQVTEGSIFYTLKYMDKRGTKYPNGFDGEKEFSRMSKGLGLCYLFDDNLQPTKSLKWHLRHPEINMVHTQNGYSIPLPRYYSRKFYEHLKDDNGLYHKSVGILKDNRTVETSRNIIKHNNEKLIEAVDRE